MSEQDKLTCKLCGKVLQGGRAFHGHMMKSHEDIYRDSEFDRMKFVDKVENAVDNKKPSGFRFLNRRNQQENLAYGEGYRYIDAEQYVYTAVEAVEKGWI